MFKLLSFLVMAKVKILAHIFYTGRARWLSDQQEASLADVNLVVFLNHTSLFEPLFLRFAPWSFVWRVSQKLVVPGADVTMRRPFAGKVLKAMMPGCIPISRMKDETWDHFLSHVNEDVITAILPEGRMKRRNGLDKYGKPMDVRGGIADILARLNTGKILFFYSGGLHHIQVPGDRLPKIFKPLSANLEIVDIQTYKEAVAFRPEKGFKAKVIGDLNQRLLDCVP